MLRIAVALSLASAADPSPRVAQLVQQLGSPDFRTREAASKELESAGRAALEPLRAAAKSPDAEVARRAAELLPRVSRKVESDEALAPTLVELNFTDRPLSEVVLALDKQAGGAADRLAAADPTRRVTVATTGKVPYWDAVAAVRRSAGVPAVAHPSCVSGAVRVDAPPLPDAVRATVARDRAALRLHVSAEPKLKWEAVTGVRVTKVTADGGRELPAGAADDGAARVAVFDEVSIAELGPGGVVLVPNRQPKAARSPVLYATTPAETVVRLKLGDAPVPKRLAVLEGVLLGVVRRDGKATPVEVPFRLADVPVAAGTGPVEP